MPRRLRGAVTLLAALVAAAGLAGLQAPAAFASAGVARAGAADHALAASGAPALAHSRGGAAAAPGPAARLRPVVRTAARHDLSAPLRRLRLLKPVRPGKPTAVPLGSPRHALQAAGTLRTADVQRGATVTTNTMPAFGQNFDGVSNLNGVFPPDTNMAVGPKDIVQAVNTSLAVYDKSGSTLLGPETLSTLWQGLGGECDPLVDPNDANSGDVVSLYDEAANRFIVTQLAIPQADTGSGGYHECIAISQAGDPTGAWYRYDFFFSSTTLNDYPKWGVWPDAYYMSDNDFANGVTASGVSVTAFDRAQMLAGQQATSVQFTIGAQYSSLLPGSAEGAALGSTPPGGAPNPFFMSCDAANGGPCASDQLDEWDFHVDWSSPGNSTFGNNGAPSLTIPVAAFNSNLCNYNGACIQQPGTSQKLDALSDRLMYQAAYRNLGGGTQAIVFNQTVNVSASPVSAPQAGVRWYELTNAGPGWTLSQQGSYAPDSDNRWMGSANIDASGDIALGYSVSSAVTYPSIRVAGRLAGDPAGQLSQGEETLIAGAGSQTGQDLIGRGRWGDYSAMQVDPADACTFWYTQEYMATTSKAGWQTRIGSFRYPSCTTGAHGTVSGTLTDAATGKPVPGGTVSTDTGSSTTTDSQGHYALVLPAGSYTLTFRAFGYADQAGQAVQVTSGATTTENAALSQVPLVHVTGTVTDGSGQGWALHASIAITGRPGGPVWASPGTGQYSVDLPQNATYQLTVTAGLPGYQVLSDSVTVGAGNLTHNISVPVDVASCNAPGYRYAFGNPSLSENFDSSTTIPATWATADNNGSGALWQVNDPLGFPGLSGGSGNFADIDGEYYGRQGLNVDAALTTPVLDLSGDQVPILEFNNEYIASAGQTGDVDLSTDGGRSWTNLWEHTTDSIFGPDQETISVPQAGGHSAVEFRFHYTTTQDWGGWWEVDNVIVQNRSCSPVPGGLVVGQVTDANTGTGLNSVTVTSTDNSQSVTTGPTGDPALGNGYYWMFSTLAGAHALTAADGAYQAGRQTVTITAGSATEADFALDAGRLSVTPPAIQASQVLGSTTTQAITIKNTGTAAASVNLVQEGGPAFKVLAAQGAPLRLAGAGPDGGTFPVGWSGNQPGGLGQGVTAGTPAGPTWSAIAPYPSRIVDNAADYIDGKLYSVGGYDGKANLSAGYAYDPVQNTWSPIASMPQIREKPGAAALGGKLYVSGGWDNHGNPVAETDAYDPSSNSWSTLAPNPSPVAAPAVAVANGEMYLVGGCASVNGNCPPSTTVEVYNPKFGSWSTAAPYPQPTSFMSCAGIRGKVYCAGGVDGNTGATYSTGYAYDPASNTWSPIASMPIDLWGSAYGAANGLFVVSTGVTNGFSTATNQGYAYDPTTNAWTAIPNAQYTVYRSAGVCGFYKTGGSLAGNPLNPQSQSEWLAGLTGCGITGFPWMSESTTTATLQPGQSVSVTVTLTATPADQVAQPGAYTAGIGFEQDTPYPVSPVDVTMTVTPPKGWGKIGGTLSGKDCNQVTAPLRGVVYADGKGYSFTLPTDASGGYGFWAPAGASPFAITGSAAGWIAVSTSASIKGGKTTAVNLTLRPQAC